MKKRHIFSIQLIIFFFFSPDLAKCPSFFPLRSVSILAYTRLSKAITMRVQETISVSHDAILPIELLFYYY